LLSVIFFFALQSPVIAQSENARQLMPPPGSSAVGFKTTNLYDDSRESTPAADPAPQSSGRRIQVFEWYPSDKGGSAMSTLDYLRIERSPTESDWRKRELSEDTLRAFASSKSPMLAKLDAPAKQERFPVLVYAPSLSASPTENADLCEFLASQGYVVLASPSLGANTTSMTDDVHGLKAQARDISFLIDYARSQSNTNIGEVAVIGYSWGGLANVYAATQDGRIKALVSLDGSIRYYVNVAWESGIHPEQMTQPLLIFTQGYIALESDLVNALISEGRPSLLSSWKHGDLYNIEMAAMQHSAFASMNLRNDELSDQDLAQPGYDRLEAKESFTAVAKYTAAFLNSYLKHDAGAETFLKRTTAENGVSRHLMYVNISAARGVASTLDALRSEMEKRGFAQGAQIVAEAKSVDPSYKVDEKALLAWGGDLLDQGKLEAATEVFKLEVAMYPNSSPGYSSLANAYDRAGQKALAIESFRKALQLDPQNYFAMDRLKALN
jgi:dienelactone hydrolase